MKTILLLCMVVAALFLVAISPVSVLAHSLSWTAPTQNEDGTPLSDLAGYNVYRTAPGSRTKLNSALVTTLTYTPVSHMVEGQSFVVTAVDSGGNESDDSNTATYANIAPKAPSGLLIMP